MATSSPDADDSRSRHDSVRQSKHKNRCKHYCDHYARCCPYGPFEVAPQEAEDYQKARNAEIAARNAAKEAKYARQMERYEIQLHEFRTVELPPYEARLCAYEEARLARQQELERVAEWTRARNERMYPLKAFKVGSSEWNSTIARFERIAEMAAKDEVCFARAKEWFKTEYKPFKPAFEFPSDTTIRTLIQNLGDPSLSVLVEGRTDECVSYHVKGIKVVNKPPVLRRNGNKEAKIRELLYCFLVTRLDGAEVLHGCPENDCCVNPKHCSVGSKHKRKHFGRISDEHRNLIATTLAQDPKIRFIFDAGVLKKLKL